MYSLYEQQSTLLTPSEEHSFEHESGLRGGEHGYEDLVHVDRLHQHPGERGQYEVVSEKSYCSAGVKAVDQQTDVLLQRDQQKGDIHQQQWHTQVQQDLPRSVPVQTPAQNKGRIGLRNCFHFIHTEEVNLELVEALIYLD